MKVIIAIFKNPFFENTASANRWRTLIEGLTALSIDVEIIVTGGYSSFAEYKQLGNKGIYKDVAYRYASFQFNDNVWFRRINRYILNPLLAGGLKNKIVKMVVAQPNAILWTQADLFGFELAVAVKEQKPGYKTFLEMSEFLDIHKFNKGNALQEKEGDKRQEFFEKKALYAYNGIALMTKTLFKHYQDFPGKLPKLLHLPMTVDLDRFTNKQAVPEGFEKPYVAFVGVMNDQKDGVNILIESFANIASQFPDHKLYLVGPWNYDTPGHEALIKEKGLENRIFWKGEFPRDVVPAIITNAKILALPRPDSKQAQGGFPTKLGEYLATGNPVCATTVGELPDYLTNEESVYFATPGSIPSFTDAMQKVLQHPDRAEQVGNMGRQVAQTHFNKDKQAQKLYDFLQQL